MDLTSVKTIKNLLSKRGLRPSKGLGQNFLIDEDSIGKIIEAIDIQPDETIIEIGPGPGALTQELAKRAKKVIAIEKDQNMVEILKETLKDYKNVEVINEDVRLLPISEIRRRLPPEGKRRTPSGGVRISEIGQPGYKVVGNLPFYLTAPVIRQFLELADTRCPQMTLVVQKEVARRICAEPPDMNLLAVSVQFYAEPKIISYISKNSFWPSPEVDAAIIKITPRSVPTPDVGTFFRMVKAGFSQPRKQLINNLSRSLDIDKAETGKWLLRNGIQPNQRAETLSVDNWRNLTKSFKIK